MKHYREFLKYLIGSEYQFERYSDFFKNGIEGQSIVLRHDVHARDIDCGYQMLNIEADLGIVNHSTYFVMYKFPAYYRAQRNREASPEILKKYEAFIKSLLSKGVEVQPHIDPISAFIKEIDRSWLDLSIEEAREIFLDNYEHVISDNEQEIIIKKNDLLNLEKYRNFVVDYTLRYIDLWQKKFGVTPGGFAPHISSKVSITNIIPSSIIYEDKHVKSKLSNFYNATSPDIFSEAKLLSDNSRPRWMIEYQDIPRASYHMEIHPYLWREDNIQNMKIELANGYPHKILGYPYLAVQESVLNITDYLNSGLSALEYNEKSNITAL